MMDARAPGDGRITISLPIFVSVVPIEKRKGSYNRESTIEWIEEAFKKAGWNPNHGLRGPLAVTIRSASLPPPSGLSKRGQVALQAGEVVWRTGRPPAGALGDIVAQAMGVSSTQIVRIVWRSAKHSTPRSRICRKISMNGSQATMKTGHIRGVGVSVKHHCKHS
jgi:hypothetical protein